MIINEIIIRTTLRPGDIGYISHLHGIIYNREYQYGNEFEVYVANGLIEFYNNYDPKRDCLWICEHLKSIIGFMLLMHRTERVAQLRFFLLQPEYRGIGLGNKLMLLYIAFLKSHEYKSAYLWTTNELPVAAHLYMKYGFRLTEEKSSSHLGKPVIEQRYDLIL